MSKTIQLNLVPMSSLEKTSLESCGYNSLLQLHCTEEKTVCDLIEKITLKWINKNNNLSIVAGELQFYPIPLFESQSSGWNKYDNITLWSIHKQLNSPQIFKLGYTWHDKPTLLLFAINNSLSNNLIPQTVQPRGNSPVSTLPTVSFNTLHIKSNFDVIALSPIFIKPQQQNNNRFNINNLGPTTKRSNLVSTITITPPIEEVKTSNLAPPVATSARQLIAINQENLHPNQISEVGSSPRREFQNTLKRKRENTIALLTQSGEVEVPSTEKKKKKKKPLAESTVKKPKATSRKVTPEPVSKTNSASFASYLKSEALPLNTIEQDDFASFLNQKFESSMPGCSFNNSNSNSNSLFAAVFASPINKGEPASIGATTSNNLPAFTTSFNNGYNFANFSVSSNDFLTRLLDPTNSISKYSSAAKNDSLDITSSDKKGFTSFRNLFSKNDENNASYNNSFKSNSNFNPSYLYEAPANSIDHFISP